MDSGWRYRIASVAGTAVLTALAITFINLPAIQDTFALVPYFGRPAPNVLTNGELSWTILTTLAVTLAAMWPVFQPGYYQRRQDWDTDRSTRCIEELYLPSVCLPQ